MRSTIELVFLLIATGCREPVGTKGHPSDEVTCAAGEVADGDACVPEACGAGTWGALSVDDGDVFVEQGAEAYGAGTQVAPMRTLAEGLELALEKGASRVVVAAGTYLESLDLDERHDGLTLAGRCRDLVLIDASDAGDDASALSFQAEEGRPELTLTGFSLAGGSSGGIYVRDASLVLRDAALVDNRVGGLVLDGQRAEAVLERVEVARTQPDDSGRYGWGLNVFNGAELRATDSTIRESHDYGVYASGGGTRVELVGTLVQETQTRPSGVNGGGLYVQSRASLLADGCEVSGNHYFGVLATDAQTSVELVDTQVLDTLPEESGSGGMGVALQLGASLRAESSTLVGNHDVGIKAMSDNTSVTLVDTEISETDADNRGGGGWGLQVLDGAELSATSVRVMANREIGVYVEGDTTFAQFVESVISQTRPDERGDGGRGVNVQEGATVVLTDTAIEFNSEMGIYAGDEGTSVTLDGSWVTDTQLDGDGSFGLGIYANKGAVVYGIGCEVARNHDAGVVAYDDGTRIELESCSIVDTQLNERGTEGLGASIEEGARMECLDCTFRGNHTVAVFADGQGTSLELIGSTIEQTVSGSNGTEGRGVLVQLAAEAVLESCTVSGNTYIGVSGAGEGTLVTLVDTTVRDTLTDETDTGTGMADEGGVGVLAIQGASVVVQGGTVSGNHGAGIAAQDTGSSVEVVEASVTGNIPGPDGLGGMGLIASFGGRISARDVEISANHSVGAQAEHAGSEIELDGCVVTGTRPDAENTLGTGLVAQEGASLVATSTDVVDNEGPGLYAVGSGALLSCTSCTVSRNRLAGGIAVESGALEIIGSTLEENAPDEGEGGGVGLLALGTGAPQLVLSGSSVGPHAFGGIWLQAPGSYVIEDSDLVGGLGQQPYEWVHLHGDAVFATGGVQAWDEDARTGLLLSGNTIRDSAGAGVMLDGSTASLESNTWLDNATDVVQQRCELTQGLDTLDDQLVTEICVGTNRTVALLEFSLKLVDVSGR